MFAYARGFGRDGRLSVRIALSLVKHRCVDKWNDLVKHRRIAGNAAIKTRNKRQPKQVIGYKSPHAPPSWRMPPMLNISFLELMRGRQKNLRSGNFRLCVDQRHYILQLVTKTERAARLIKSRASPNTARQRLI